MKLDQIPIGRFSQITRLSKKALRIYDERRILIPAIKDPLTGYRYYSIDQIEKGLKIKILSWLGFGLKAIKNLSEITNSENNKRIKRMFDKRMEEVKAQIEKLKKIENFLLGKQNLSELFIGITEPIFKNVPDMRVISRRERGTHDFTINKLIREIIDLINNERNQQENVKMVGPPIYICHDKSYKETKADIEIAIPVTGRVVIQENYDVKNLEGSNVISIISKGPYGNLGTGYIRIYEYATRNNMDIIGPSRQIFLTNPKEKSESDLITEIQLPVES